MTCTNCGKEIRTGMKFCGGCGTSAPAAPAGIACAGCGSANLESARFCVKCGNALGAVVPAAQTLPSPLVPGPVGAVAPRPVFPAPPSLPPAGFPLPPGPPQPFAKPEGPPPAATGRNPLSIVLLALLLGAALGGGWYGYRWWHNRGQTARQAAAESAGAPAAAVPAGARAAGSNDVPPADTTTPVAASRRSEEPVTQAPVPRANNVLPVPAPGVETAVPAESAPARAVPSPPPPAPVLTSPPAPSSIDEAAPSSPPPPRQERVPILRPESQPPPAAERYSGPASGIVVWSGVMDKDAVVIVDGSNVNQGRVNGVLPGVPVIVEVQPNDVGIAEAPAPSNGWKRLALRSRKGRHTVVTIRWRLL
jgi:hypothetical protein